MPLCFHLRQIFLYSVLTFSVRYCYFIFQLKDLDSSFWHCCCAVASAKNVLFSTTKGLKTGYDSCSKVLWHVRPRESDNLQDNMQRWQSSVPHKSYVSPCLPPEAEAHSRIHRLLISGHGCLPAASCPRSTQPSRWHGHDKAIRFQIVWVTDRLWRKQ